MKPTIAIDARMIRHSGIGTYIQRLVPGVIEAMPKHRLLLLGDPVLLRGFAPGAEIVEYKLPIYSMRHHRAAPKLLSDSADLLWTPHFNAPAARSLRQVATIHDVLHVARPEFFPGWHKRFVAHWWYRNTTRLAERLIAVSEFTKGEIGRFFPDAAPKTTVVHNFVEPGYADFEPLPIPYMRPFVLTAGNIKPNKNVGALLKAFELVKDDLDVDLVVVGQAEGFVTADPVVKELLEKGSDRVHFPGFVEMPMLKSLYKSAVCTVFPSLYEGFGLGPLESMAIGCPVLASDIPAHVEVCGEAAAMFDPTLPEDLPRGLRGIVSDVPLRERLMTAGHERTKLFTRGEAVARTVEVLRSLVN